MKKFVALALVLGFVAVATTGCSESTPAKTGPTPAKVGGTSTTPSNK